MEGLEWAGLKILNVLKFESHGLFLLPSVAREELGRGHTGLLKGQVSPWAPSFRESSSMFFFSTHCEQTLLGSVENSEAESILSVF